MKKKYISPELFVVESFGNPLLDIGTTIDVITDGGGASQSGAEAKKHDMADDDELDEFNDSIIKYRRDPMDFIPKTFTKHWAEE